MKRRNVIYLSGVFVVVAASLILSVAAGQDKGAEKARCKSTEKTAGMTRRCKMIMGASIYLDSPAAIYGQADSLGLSEVQKKALTQIINDARKKAIDVLTPEQREKLGDVSAEPLTMMQMCQKMCGKMPCGQGKGAPVACPITGKKTWTCPVDCAKPCCAAKNKLTEAEQKTCPVMGGTINKKVFTEYKGKKVYFCCGGCKPKFEKNPEKYLDKLPQFKG